MRWFTALLWAVLVACSSDGGGGPAEGEDASVADVGSEVSAPDAAAADGVDDSVHADATEGDTATVEDGTSGDVTYTPWDGTCPPVESTGGFNEAVGSWAVTNVCLGSVPLALLAAVCSGAVVTDATYTDWDGFIWLHEDGRYFQHARFSTTVEAFIPQDCANRMGGDCDAVADLLLTLASQTGAEGTVECDASPGGCLCAASGTGETGNLGVAEPAEGGMYIAYYDLEREPDGALWSVNRDGDALTVYNQTTGKTFAGVAGDPPGACELYCRAYWMGCREVSVTTPYDGLDDCLEKCPSLPTVGSEQETGNSVECRMHQLFTGADPSLGELETYCQNAQFDPTGPCTDE